MINLNADINETDKIITISLNEQKLNIDYNGDVDFTNLISCLTEKIDTHEKVNIDNLNSITTEDPKATLVFETFNKIFEMFNENLDEV